MRTITTCIIFDEHAASRDQRVKLLQRALNSLKRRDILDIREIVALGSRAVCLEAVEDAENALLLADMASEGEAWPGNLGTRVCRAIAQRREAAAKTWRIMWTKHHHLDVLVGMDRWIHALVYYEPASAEHLELAIEYVIQHSPVVHAETQAFPPALPVAQWRNGLRQALEDVIPGGVKIGDDLIALGLYHRMPQNRIDRQLHELEGQDHRKSVNDLLEHLVNEGKASEFDHARHILREAINDVSEESANDPLRPAVADGALKCLTDLGPWSHEEFLATTWLTTDEDRLARAFLRLYGPAVKNLPPKASDKRYEILDRTLSDPAYTAVRDELGLTNADLSYALWTLQDLHLTR